MKDLYKNLGVAEDADEDTIKKAYRKLAKENHPDATGGDKRKTERFKEVNEAYAVLGDKDKRAEYDRLKHAPVGVDGMPQGFDADTFAQVFGGNFGRGQRAGNVNVTTDFSGDIGDLFSSLFGRGFGGPGDPSGRTGQRPRPPSRGPDMSGVVEVSFREAALGTRRSVRSGSGKTMEIAIPAGVETGGRLRLGGLGGTSTRGGDPGDLHLEVRVLPDPVLRRSEGTLDVELDLPLTVAEAALGTKIDVPTVEGQALVTIPAGTSSGVKLRLRGKGVKKGDGVRGDQICHIQIVVPKLAPDDEEGKRLFEEVAKKQSKPVRNF